MRTSWARGRRLGLVFFVFFFFFLLAGFIRWVSIAQVGNYKIPMEMGGPKSIGSVTDQKESKRIEKPNDKDIPRHLFGRWQFYLAQATASSWKFQFAKELKVYLGNRCFARCDQYRYVFFCSLFARNRCTSGDAEAKYLAGTLDLF